MANGDIYTVKVVCYDTTQLGMNIRQYMTTAESGPPILLSVIADFFTNTLKTGLLPLVGSAAQFLGCSVKKIWPEPQSLEVPTTLAAMAGTGGAQMGPKQVAGVIKLTTNFPGRAGRGRAYVPFVATSAVTGDGVPTAAYISNLQIYGNALSIPGTVTSGGSSITFNPVIWDRKLKRWTGITGYVARAKFGTQRRRGDFGRVNIKPW
jgi:hypothetical protein